MLRGEPGIGKTRLLAELARRAGERGLRVARGRATTFEREIPFAAVIDALDGVLPAPILPPTRLQELRAAIDGLGTFALVLDDLQWADAGSLEVVADLLARPPAALVVLAYRSAAAPALLRDAVRAADAVDLPPLARDAVPEVDDATYAFTGGNPFYLLEVTLAGGVDAGVPETVRAALGAEVAALPPNTTPVSRAAAVLGESLDPEHIAAVAELPMAQTRRALHDLVAADLLRCTEGRLAFRHPIVGRAVYDLAGPAWTLGAHARAAAALAARRAPIAQRAPHLERAATAGDAGAIALLHRAGAAAEGREPATAARWFAAAARLTAAGDAPARAAEHLLPLGRCLVATGRVEDAREALEQAVELVGPDCTELRAALVADAARVDHLRGRHGVWRAAIERALDGGADGEVGCRLLLELGSEAWQAQEWTTMARAGAGALALARTLERRELEADAHGTIAFARTELGEHEAANRHADAGLATIEGLADGELAGRLDAALLVGFALVGLERCADAVGLLDRSLAVARSSGQCWSIVPLHCAAADAEVPLGHLAGATAHAEAATEAAAGTGNDTLVLWAAITASRVALARGDLTEAQERARLATERAQAAPGALYAPAARCHLGAAMVASGEPAAGTAELLLGGGGPELELSETRLRPRWYAVLAEAELAQARPDAAEAWIERGARVAEDAGLSASRADLDRVRAALLLARGDSGAAAGVAGGAADRLRVLGHPLPAAHADVVAGRALAREGRQADAVVRLERARGALERAGARRWRDEAARELRALGRRVASRGPRPRRTDGAPALSPREREVAGLVVAGRTNREIAAELLISEKTVEAHLANMFGKLGVSSRTALAGAIDAHAQGAVPADRR